ncbi:unnamed protein product [Sphagnum troendelagicum]|uniref:Chromatin modification-related protein MEAF6 n=3 Tax=Sphagnum TaxID=13804 RepID=A0ABP0TN83_9BRYO
MSGQRTSNPQQTLQLLMAKKEKLQEELRSVEKQVYDLETTYLHDSSQSGNVLKGFDGFLASGKGASNLKRPRKFQPEDRLFSLSSVTSPAVSVVAVMMDGMGPGRKAGGTPTNGPGKQKRGRTGPREGKRIKQVNEQEPEEEDDPDGLSR